MTPALQTPPRHRSEAPAGVARRPRFGRRDLLVVLAYGLGAALALAPGFGAPALPGSRWIAFAALLLQPGLTVYLFFERTPRLFPLALSAVALSPVLASSAAALLMLAGLSAVHTANAVLVASFALAPIAVVRSQSATIDAGVSRREVALLAGVILFFCGVTGFLPFSSEWWRYWSDAWFHGAVIAEIDAFGIPPQDPYFAGLPLQYMWAYHVLVLVASRAMALDPMFVIPILNVQALAAFALAAYLLSTRLRKSFVFGLIALLTVLLGLNAAVWFFLPVRLVRAFVGEVRGWSEVVRSYSLVPFDLDTIQGFLVVYFNPTFLLNKFIVATALSLALALMGTFWYGAIRYLSDRRAVGLVIVFLSNLGMLLFHTLFGFIMLAGLFGGTAFLLLERRRFSDFTPAQAGWLAAAGASSLIAAAPYVYSVVHSKETEQLFPFGVSLDKIAAITISCALVFVLAAFQVRRLIASRTAAERYLLFATVTLVGVCLVVVLPGPNTFDKLPFFIFFPTAVIASWTIAERIARQHAKRSYRRKVFLVFLALVVPVNALALAAYYNTPRDERTSRWERQAGEWVHSNTPRDALFLDSRDRVFLLILGPRRYYWGREGYARQWGYETEEMDRRRHVRNNIYSSAPLDLQTLETLGAMEHEMYVIVREDEGVGGGTEVMANNPSIFEKVFAAGPLSILKVDPAACRSGAAKLNHENY